MLQLRANHGQGAFVDHVNKNDGGTSSRPPQALDRDSDFADLMVDSIPAPLGARPLVASGDVHRGAWRGPNAVRGQNLDSELVACIQACTNMLLHPDSGDAPGEIPTELLMLSLPHNPQVQLSALLYLAEVAHEHDPQPLGHILLRHALTLVRLTNLHAAPAAPAQSMSHLCSSALQARIETETVRRIIVEQKLQPGPADTLHWPWPMRIYTLGRFGMRLNDEPLVFNSKSPRKALELLQLLIASGGREVNTTALMNGLWPEESSSNLRNLFDNTLHRLRRLLGTPEALPMHNAKLSLDPRYCWVDAWAFGRLTNASNLPGVLDTPARTPLQEREARAAMRLYTGHFLQSEGDIPWALPFRDRVRNRFHRLITSLGQRLENEEAWDKAIAVYEHGLEIDNLSEALYQHLMACHLQRGEHAQALMVYRRCRELLSIVLGVAPSARTEQLYRTATAARR